jgi:hypothetical protein
MAQPWFWGDCSGSLAQSKLSVSNVPNGAFLIRFSRMDANFTLSYVHGGRVWHTRIVHAYGSASYILEGGRTEYNSLGAFVAALKEKAVVKEPCPGWPFEPFFGSVKGQGGCKWGVWSVLLGLILIFLLLHYRCRVTVVGCRFRKIMGILDEYRTLNWIINEGVICAPQQNSKLLHNKNHESFRADIIVCSMNI